MLQKNGFTLIEISIVLVIIGLIAGGVIAGRSLIRASEIRSFIQEIEKFRTDMHIFEAKYNGKAGDIVNATDFWGALSANDTTCRTLSATDSKTCNGNGDGRLESHEGFRMWQQLSSAGLMGGEFTGTAGPLGPNDAIPSVNVPVSTIENIQYMVQNFQMGQFRYFDTVMGNILFIGESELQYNNQPWVPFLTSQETYNIDKKIDDGDAVTGKVVGSKNWLALPGEDPFECTTSNDESTATYNLGKDGIICSFSLLID